MNRRVIQILNIFCLASFLIPSLRATIPEPEAYGLYNALVPQFNYLSPLHGFNWWNNKIIENMYRYGNNNDATIKLIKLLFYLDQTGTGFHISERNPVKAFDAEFNGKLLKLIVEAQQTIDTPETQELLKKSIKAFFESGKLKAREDKKDPVGNKLPQLIVDSLLEQQGSNRKYIHYTTHLALLTFLSNKVQIKNEYDAFFDEIKPAMISGWQKLIKGSYQLEELVKIWQAIVTAPTSITDFITKNYEAISLAASYIPKTTNPYPPIIPQSYSVKYKSYTFADCGETSLRNFLNIITYQPISQTFNPKLLEQPGITVANSVTQFYAKYPKADDAAIITQDKNPYEDWAKVVSELKGVTYSQGDVCEIKGTGLNNMLMVIDHILFQTNPDELKKLTNSEQLDRLTQTISRDDFNISWDKVAEFNSINSTWLNLPEKTVVNTKNNDIKITFNVKTKKDAFSFDWIFKIGHFEIYPVISSNPSLKIAAS